MDTFSSVVIAVVFLSGASVGASLTAIYRYAARERIQRDFQTRLAAIADARQRAHTHDGVAVSPATVRPAAGEPSLPEDIEEPEHEDDMNWVASHTPDKSDALQL